MQWAEFLSDHELNSEAGYHGPPDGEYLLRKIIHDVRECLSTYKESVRITSALKEEIPAATSDCLDKWKSTIEKWLWDISSLVEKIGSHPPTSPEWEKLIACLGEIIEETPAFRTEMRSLELPTMPAAKQIVQISIRSAEKLDLLWRDIQAQEYKRLWTTLRYGDLGQDD